MTPETDRSAAVAALAEALRHSWPTDEPGAALLSPDYATVVLDYLETFPDLAVRVIAGLATSAGLIVHRDEGECYVAAALTPEREEAGLRAALDWLAHQIDAHTDECPILSRASEGGAETDIDAAFATVLAALAASDRPTAEGLDVERLADDLFAAGARFPVPKFGSDRDALIAFLAARLSAKADSGEGGGT